MTQSYSLPLVTLGMPVYNEAKYIRESLENISKQTYPNIQLIIADNGSNDGTSEICAEFAARYPHIVHIRHSKNIGQHSNFNFLPKSATGTYFCWVSGHDLLDPEFTEKCVTELERHPKAVLAYPRTINMTKEGKLTREKVRRFDIRTMNPAQRFSEVMWRVDCNYVYGMWRLAPMLKSDLFTAVPACDRVFLAQMAILGMFVPVDTFKYYRMNREDVQTEVEKRHRIMGYLQPDKTYTDAQLTGNYFYAPTQAMYYSIVDRAPFPLITRLRLRCSVWAGGVVKCHMFPGADFFSVLVKKTLPKPLLGIILRRIQ